MSTLLKPFELVLNKAIAQDPETKSKLDLFEGKRIRIRLTDIVISCDAIVSEQNIRLEPAGEQTADLQISATTFSLLKLTHDPDSLFSSGIDINGDIRFAKDLQDLMQGFDFDWEAQLSLITGDTLAHPISHGFSQFMSWSKNTGDNLVQDLAEYLREESQMLPDQSQIKEFIMEIDTLRADLDRIEARINRLISK
ncbi:MAG: hypothetical protein DRI65_02740 [Chloroflexota bacterium]|nr:MAG: hypothetical protein DRI65_02740 [Chloroflexota bacterium]